MWADVSEFVMLMCSLTQTQQAIPGSYCKCCQCFALINENNLYNKIVHIKKQTKILEYLCWIYKQTDKVTTMTEKLIYEW